MRPPRRSLCRDLLELAHLEWLPGLVGDQVLGVCAKGVALSCACQGDSLAAPHGLCLDAVVARGLMGGDPIVCVAVLDEILHVGGVPIEE